MNDKKFRCYICKRWISIEEIRELENYIIDNIDPEELELIYDYLPDFNQLDGDEFIHTSKTNGNTLNICMSCFFEGFNKYLNALDKQVLMHEDFITFK